MARNVCRQLRAQGVRIWLIARYGSAPDEFEAERPPAAGLWRYLVFSLWRGFSVMRKGRPSIIVCPGIVDAPVALILSVLFCVPFVVLAHGSDIVREGWIYQCVVRWLFRRADGIAANSENTRRELVERGCCMERIEVIHPGVEDMKATETPAHSGDRGPVIMTAGRIIRRKGIGDFIEHVLPSLVKQFPGLVYFVAGGDATQSLTHGERLLDQLKAKAVALGLEKHVRFTGMIDDGGLMALYANTDLFVLPVIPVPGDVEGFGIVLLEAAQHGLPSVSTRCGGIPDAVADGETGILVEPRDWPAMSEQIAGLLNDPARRKMLGDAARKRASNEFNWTLTGQKYHDFLWRVIKRHA